LSVEASGRTADLWKLVLFHIAPEKLQEDQDLSIHAVSADDLKHLESLVLKDFSLLSASLRFFAYLKDHIDPGFFFFGMRHLVVVIADEDHSCYLEHPVNEFRVH
jgi:hypothetical protein